MGADIVFPQGFLWGSATSAHQVEGNNVHNDWWAWEQAGRVKESSGRACDHYGRFRQDFDLAARMHHRAHRFSVEWSRCEPTEGGWDDEAFAHYRDVVQALQERHLEPIVTLHHFTTPQWLVRDGGWANPKSVDRFARYAERVAKALGPFVRYWITINEPMVYVNMHYVEGIGPPGAQRLSLGLRVAEHLARAHALAYRAIHGTVDDLQAIVHAGEMVAPRVLVSIAKAVPVFLPCRPWWPFDRAIVRLTDRLFNAAFVDAITEGVWSVPGNARRRIPEGRGALDFLGVNYYAPEFLSMRPSRGSGFISRCQLDSHTRHASERNEMGWAVAPDLLQRALIRWASLRLPLFVTENGTCMVDDGRRWSFIARHLRALSAVMDRGVTVLGYLYWSLLDNFEWGHGFGPRFGLVEVDYATQERRMRESGHRYAQVCRTGRLADDGPP